MAAAMGKLHHDVSYLMACLLIGLIPLVWGRFVVEKNSITVSSPDSLKGTYDSAIGNFGVPLYGGTLAGTVVYVKENAYACDDFGSSDKFRSRPGGLPMIVVVDTGDCYFAKKAWNAQNAGAAAVLVADDRDEPLITMAAPPAEDAEYLQNITIPSALIQKSFGDKLKKAIGNHEIVNCKLDWRESVPHPDDRVEYELWTNSNDECGPKCDSQIEFVKSFKGAAQLLDQGGYTLFTPHYITWYCPEAFVTSRQCISQCINKGRYCVPDPELDLDIGYDGKDVVTENLRQLCVYIVANQTSRRPWVWWDYVTDFQIRCPMSEKKYNQKCAEQVITSLGLDVNLVRTCMGDPDADAENMILKREQESQIGHGSRGDVTMLPTLIINNVQYRGKLDKGAILKAICAGFEEKTEPAVCLTPDMETNECLTNNGGCWQNVKENLTACRDTFRGKVCECPLVDGVQFKGDGYTSCEGKKPERSRVGWVISIIALLSLATVAVGAYLIYKYRLRSYMDSEIRAIMAQYMPLDNQDEIRHNLQGQI